jgi:hypothetical protein
MIQPPAVLLPRLYPQGNVLVGKKYYSQYFLEWANFGPEPGPDGCASQRFALAQSTQDRLQALALTMETLIITSKSIGRQRDPIAVAGCISEIADTLADCAVKPSPDAGVFCWISSKEKHALRCWIAQRIWRMAGALKNGHSPESLARLTFFCVDEVKPKVQIISEELHVGREDGRTYREEGDFEYRAIAVKGGKMYRIRLLQELGHDAYVMKIADGQIVKFIVAMFKEPYAIRLGGDDARLDHVYVHAEQFIDEAVINGLQQEVGVVHEIGPVPSLSMTYDSSSVYRFSSFSPVGVRVGDLAKEFGVPCKIVIEVARSLNIEAKNSCAVFKPGQVDRIRAKMSSVQKP